MITPELSAYLGFLLRRNKNLLHSQW